MPSSLSPPAACPSGTGRAVQARRRRCSQCLTRASRRRCYSWSCTRRLRSLGTGMYRALSARCGCGANQRDRRRRDQTGLTLFLWRVRRCSSGNEEVSADAPAGAFPRGGTGVPAGAPTPGAPRPFSGGPPGAPRPRAPDIFMLYLHGQARRRHSHLHAHPHRRPGADGDYTPALFLRTNSTSD